MNESPKVIFVEIGVSPLERKKETINPYKSMAKWNVSWLVKFWHKLSKKDIVTTETLMPLITNLRTRSLDAYNIR